MTLISGRKRTTTRPISTAKEATATTKAVTFAFLANRTWFPGTMLITGWTKL